MSAAAFEQRRTCACGYLDEPDITTLVGDELHGAGACLVVTPAQRWDVRLAEAERLRAIDWRATP